jgi:hypothetical protein
MRHAAALQNVNDSDMHSYSARTGGGGRRQAPFHDRQGDDPSNIHRQAALTDSPRPVRVYADQPTRLVHVANELDRLTADLAVLDVTERPRRQIHSGTKLLTAVGALNRDELRELRRRRVPGLEHGLEPIQRIDGMRVGWIPRFPGHSFNLHRGQPPCVGTTRGLASAERGPQDFAYQHRTPDSWHAKHFTPVSGRARRAGPSFACRYAALTAKPRNANHTGDLDRNYDTGVRVLPRE